MLSIMNAALLSTGCDEVVDGEGSNEWRLLSRNWPLIVEAELEDGNYNFTRETRQITTYSTGKYGFEYAYAIPITAVAVRHVWTETSDGVRDMSIDWTQDATHIHSHEDEGIWIEYLTCAAESLWSANFSRGVQMKLEATILRAIREEYPEAIQAEQQAEVYFQRARTLSSRSRSARSPYREGQLAASRFGRG